MGGRGICPPAPEEGRGRGGGGGGIARYLELAESGEEAAMLGFAMLRATKMSEERRSALC